MLITKRAITGAEVHSASHLEGGMKCSGRKVSALVPAIYQGEGAMSLELPVNNALSESRV